MKKMLCSLIAMALILTGVLCGVSAEEQTVVRVAGLKGPTGMSLAHMMTENDGRYAFTIESSPNLVNPLVISGQVDIAIVPINAGAVLYNKTAGGVKALALTTRGMLYILEKGDSIQSIADLEGKTIVAAGQGATPEYVTRYILDAYDVNAQVEYLSEHAEVTAQALAGRADIVLLPEPQVTTLLMKDPSYRKALDITKEFSAAAEKNGEAEAQLSMSVAIVRTEFAKAHPELVKQFCEELKASIVFANEHVPQAAQEIAKLEIIPSAAIAEAAIPSCTLVYIDGAEMREQAAPLYHILYSANPASVGGQEPDEGYYCTNDE